MKWCDDLRYSSDRYRRIGFKLENSLHKVERRKKQEEEVEKKRLRCRIGIAQSAVLLNRESI